MTTPTKALSQTPRSGLIVANPDLTTGEAKSLLVLFCSRLNEKQRRLYAGLESLTLGHGGDAHIASILGLDPHTVAKGRQELMDADSSAADRLRAPGAGRPPQGKKTPQIMNAIANIIQYETAGDPVRGCKWTRKATGKIARQLKRMGICVSANTVGKLLKKMDYRLRKNLKSLESGLKNPPALRQRDHRFRYIRSRIRYCTANGMPSE